MPRLSLLLALSVAMAPVLARADEPPAVAENATTAMPLAREIPAPPPAAAGVPGQSVEMEQGAPAPFKGNLADATRWAHVKSLRVKAEKEAEAATAERDDARARQAAAERERDAVAASQGPSWGTLIGVTGAALVLGIVAGVVGVVVVQDRAAR